MGYGRRQARRGAEIVETATRRGRPARARKALVVAALAGLREIGERATADRRSDTEPRERCAEHAGED